MHQTRTLRPTAYLLTVSLLAPVFLGCSKGTDGANLPPVDDTKGRTAASAPPAAPQEGMSTKKKLVLLAGAAALYYMYKKHRDANNQPTNTQYYLSKNGRVYYRDANHQAHWVTPPAEGIQVPEEDAREFKDYQGYDKQTTGRDLVGIGND